MGENYSPRRQRAASGEDDELLYFYVKLKDIFAARFIFQAFKYSLGDLPKYSRKAL